jgi:hypothetical protein
MVSKIVLMGLMNTTALSSVMPMILSVSRDEIQKSVFQTTCAAMVMQIALMAQTNMAVPLKIVVMSTTSNASQDDAFLRTLFVMTNMIVDLVTHRTRRVPVVSCAIQTALDATRVESVNRRQ